MASSKKMNHHQHDPIMRSVESCCLNRIHYAYVVLAVATLGKIFTSPGQSPCIGVIIESVRLDVDISRSVMTGLYFAATTTSALILPWGGKWIDKFGPRIMVGIFACGLGLACMIMSRVAAPGGALLSISTSNSHQKIFHCLHLFIALFLLRFFGQGNLMNVSVTEINYWWIERRGVVMGIAGSVVSGTMLGIIPILMMSLMISVGWRNTYVILGMASLFVMAPMGLLFFRDRPEQYGLLPDAKKSSSSSTAGKKVTLESSDGENITVTNNDKNEINEICNKTSLVEEIGRGEVNWTSDEIFRSRAFYVFAYSDLIIAATGTAFWFHLRSVFQESGVSETTISTIYPTLAAVSVSGRLFSGWLIDATSQRHVMAIGLFLQSAGLMLVPLMMIPDISTHSNFYISKNMIAYVVALLIGSSGSFCSNVRATIYAEYYGRKYLGAVQSVASSLTVFGSAIGPFPFGIARDMSGSFALPFAAAAFFPFVAAFAVFVFGHREEYQKNSSLAQNDEGSVSLKKGYGSV